MNSAAEMISLVLDSVTWEIPVDLVRLQRDWDAANAACSAAAAGDDAALLNAARARLLDLTLELHRDPWLAGHQQDGRRYAADRALKRAARNVEG